ncbi:hypothetical protein RSOLAG1IB_01672 [Rhizoctonia solani AG-1 IB]|uniref:Gtr1/RagA G protein conserved region domain-containing protein n=1 Tax=Thanatephorus cucumeris (strain AG1-IB / isolate 7/3/14) TaxID=1108050 RepID=A0A0B7FDI8_THACB|nr:hypothetical protein RSOLAG1IB_01672 [Rhizoctonia solani AG-1 IB]
MSLPLILVLLLTSSVCAQDSTKRHKGEPCDPSRNRLNAETRKFTSDCDAMTFCSPEGECQPKGCRRDEFPFGYDPDVPLPWMCPRGQFCPDEEDKCLPAMPPGFACQLNRDDQCQPPPDRPELDNGDLTNRGAMCFKNACQYANITLGQSCEAENTVYVGYASGGRQFYNVVSRDRCAPKLWCNAQTSVCEPKATVGAACSAHKQCETYTCNTNNICMEPPGTPLRIQLWQYLVTGAGIIFLMVGMSITLFMSHKRSRAKRLYQIRAYFREQTSYRNSIISMHTNARSRISMYSASSTHHGSLAQFEETEEGLEDDEDDDRRGLLGGSLDLEITNRNTSRIVTIKVLTMRIVTTEIQKWRPVCPLVG